MRLARGRKMEEELTPELEREAIAAALQAIGYTEDEINSILNSDE